MADEVPDDAVLSDVDDDDDPAPIVLSGNPTSPEESPTAAADQRVRDLLAELDQERRSRKAAEDARSELQTSANRLRAIAQDVIKKRDEALREKEEAVRSTERLAGELSEALRLKEEALKQKEEDLKQKDSLRSEMETAAQMLVTGIDKISGKVSNFKNFSAGGLPRSQKYTGMPAVAYGVIKRANEIAEELARHIDAAAKSRDQAREQMEQRNYENAIEVSELEATIGGLREEVLKKDSEIMRLEKLVDERDAKISSMDVEVSELRQFNDECSGRLRSLEAKLDSQRPLVIDQLNYISKAYEQIHEIIRAADMMSNPSDSSESLFIWEEMDLDKNLRTLVEGTVAVYELTKVAAGKVRKGVEERLWEAKALNEKVADLLAEKKHIGTLLRSALSSKASEVLQVAENGLRQAGIDLRFINHHKNDSQEGEDDEVYTLAGALENTVKASQLEIIELQCLVETLRAESGLLKSRLDAQAKEIRQQTNQIKELEEKERVANENVEGLMTDIAAAEEEIARWKAAAEQEAAAGRAVEQEFLLQLSALQQEVEEAKQGMVELEKKLKFKEETAAAAMGARDAAENSLRLVDLRSARLRERMEELTRQIEESDSRNDTRVVQNSHRYVCWPWQWLGLNSVRYQTVQESSNEMELSEPLI